VYGGAGRLAALFGISRRGQRKLKKQLSALGAGESMLAPAFVAGQEVLFLIQRKTKGVFRFVVHRCPMHPL
jgi:hypothetical protein